MDHGLEAHVDLAAADDLCDVAGVIGFEDGDFDAFVGEESKLLGQI